MKFSILFAAICSLIHTTHAQTKTIEVSHYLFPKYIDGIVLMKSGTENKVLINYNALTEEMVFIKKGKALAISYTELQLTDTVFIQNRKFVPINGKFLELLFEANCSFFAENKCNVIYPGKQAAYGGKSQASAISSISSYSANGSVYNLTLPDDYKLKPFTHYWMRRNGKLKRVVNIKQLGNLYKDKKKSFKAYVKSHDVKIEDQKSIVELVKFMEEIN